MKNKIVDGMFKEPRMKMNLQFFAGSKDEGGDNPEDNPDDDDDPEDEPEDKTFTQEDVTAIAAREKKQGRKSILKELGFKSEKEAKDSMEAYRKWQEEHETEDQKRQREAAQKDQELSDANARAKKAEDKLAVVQAGVKSDAIDDVLSIAANKVTDEKDLASVLEDMKKDSKYSGFFKDDDSKDDRRRSTGGNLNRGKREKSKESEGARIGKKFSGSNNNDEAKKFTYF